MNTNKKIILSCASALLTICVFLGAKGISQNSGNDTAEVTSGITAVSAEAVVADVDAVSDSSVEPVETANKKEKENGDECDEKEEEKGSDGQSGTKSKEIINKDSKNKETSQNQPAVKAADQNVSGGTKKTEPDKTIETPSAVPAESAAPVADETDDKKSECSLTVTCEEVFSHMDQLSESAKKVIPSDGIILKGTYGISDGETVFDLLKKACAGESILLDYVFTPVYSTYYIKGINNLYEFDCGDESGWLYSVNGAEPGFGCSQYKLKKGDRVIFYFTCEYK